MQIRTSRKEKTAAWQKQISGFQFSGLSGTEYCRRNKLKIPTFRYWLKKLAKGIPDPSESFVEVCKPEHLSNQKPPSDFEIIFPAGPRLAFNRDIDPDNLGKIIRALRDTLC